MQRRLVFACILVILLLLTGCAQSSSVPMNYRWASVNGSRLNESQSGEQFYFNIYVDDGLIAEKVPLKINLNGKVDSGSLRFELRRPDGQAVWNSGSLLPGDFSINAEYPLPAGETGIYTLGLVHSENTSAVYNLSWDALKLGPVVLLPGIGMILVALAFIVYAAARKILDWRYLGLGALFWALTVALKFAFAIPVSPLVYNLLQVSRETLFSPGNLIAYLYIGAMTGVFEAGLAWVILRKIRWGKATWNQALVFGIGFGAFEALLLGLVNGGASLAGLLNPNTPSGSSLATLANNATLVMGMAPVVERLAVIFAHILACVLIFYAIASREAKWGWLAILYKTLLDAPGGFASFWGSNTPEKLWTLEAVIVLFGLLGLWGTIQIARRYLKLQAE